MKYPQVVLDNKELLEEAKKNHNLLTSLEDRLKEVEAVNARSANWVSEKIRINYLKSIINGRIHIGS